MGTIKLAEIQTIEINKNRFLVTTNYGSWIILNKEQLTQLKQNNLQDKELIKQLKEKAIMILKQIDKGF